MSREEITNELFSSLEDRALTDVDRVAVRRFKFFVKHGAVLIDRDWL